jgi:tRNA uridine 5-carboxymethylaminomethyl modification enzyme
VERVRQKQNNIAAIKKIVAETFVEPPEINTWFEKINTATISEKQKAQKILLRPSVEIEDLIAVLPKLKTQLSTFDKESIAQAGIQIKYEVYIEKERELVKRMSQLEELEIPESFDYKKISSLGNEAREKLTKAKPRTLGQASRISGINPSDVQILMVYMGR